MTTLPNIIPKLNVSASAKKKNSYPVEKEINTYFVPPAMSEGLMSFGSDPERLAVSD